MTGEMSDVEPVFTDEDMECAEQYPALGPQYRHAQRAAERFMAAFEDEHFKPLIGKFAEDFQDKLWSDLTQSLLSDTESNLRYEVQRMVEGTVNALLTGEEWALNFYPLAKAMYGEAPKIRAAIFEQCRDQITDLRVADLEKQVADLTSTVSSLQGRYS